MSLDTKQALVGVTVAFFSCKAVNFVQKGINVPVINTFSR